MSGGGWTYPPMLAAPNNAVQRAIGDLTTAERKAAMKMLGTSRAKAQRLPTPMPDVVELLDRYYPSSDFEIKMDGIRGMVEWDGKSVRIFNRKGDNITDRCVELATAVRTADLKPFILDGEIVLSGALTDPPTSRFPDVTKRIATDPKRVSQTERDLNPLAFVAFDCLRYADLDHVQVQTPHQDRAGMARVLCEVIEHFEPVRRAVNPLIWAQVVAEGLEGLIVKDRKGVYRPGARTEAWLKVKTETRLTCFAISYDESDKAGRDVGAVHLAVTGTDGAPLYVGKVGSGISADEQRELRRSIDAQEFPLIEVRCNGRSDNRLRFPVYLGRRTDLTHADVSTQYEFELINHAV